MTSFSRLRVWLLMGLGLITCGCPYFPPIEPPPPLTNFRPVITVISPTLQNGAIYNVTEDQTVVFEIEVDDPDTPPNELEFAWILDRGEDGEQERARGNAITFYPLVLASVSTGPHDITVRVKDGLGNEANEELEVWEFEVQ